LRLVQLTSSYLLYQCLKNYTWDQTGEIFESWFNWFSLQLNQSQFNRVWSDSTKLQCN
jgi:hypothetical protein